MRAPVLNSNRLNDLDVLLKAADNQIAYLAEIIRERPIEAKKPRYGMQTSGYLPKGLVNRFRDEHDALVRSREWLAGKIEAEREKRNGRVTAEA